MSKRFLTFLVIAIVITSLLSACNRPASTAPVSETPGMGGIPFPVQQPTTSLGTLATQTAAAKGAVVVPTATGPAAPKATVAPTTGAVQPTQPPQQPAQPTATTKPEVVIPTQARPSTYTIQSGDHYFCLARRFNLNPSELLSLNGLGSNSQAVVGQTIKIPQDGSWPSSSGSRALKGHPDTYQVQSGDTLNKIACIYGDVDPSGIIAANDLKAPYTLSAGQTLQIP
jgi:LysM repeat protein